MKHKTLAFLLAATSLAPVCAQDNAQNQATAQGSEDAGEPSQFVGRYDGSSMETATGMIVREDGTFQWGISVGSLDMRAQGEWFEEDETIIFVSKPKPVAPEFVWSGVGPRGDGPFLRVVWARDGKPFRFADVRGTCANGALINTYVDANGWSPDETCDKPQMIQLYLSGYQILSEPFELSGEYAVAEGEGITIAFQRNDLGIASFDGVMGRLEEDRLRVEGPLGVMTLRKLVPPAE